MITLPPCGYSVLALALPCLRAMVYFLSLTSSEGACLVSALLTLLCTPVKRSRSFLGAGSWGGEDCLRFVANNKPSILIAKRFLFLLITHCRFAVFSTLAMVNYLHSKNRGLPNFTRLALRCSDKVLRPLQRRLFPTFHRYLFFRVLSYFSDGALCCPSGWLGGLRASPEESIFLLTQWYWDCYSICLFLLCPNIFFTCNTVYLVYLSIF